MNVRASATPVSLGKAIAEARRACDLTQQELCAQTGIAYSTLTKIERGGHQEAQCLYCPADCPGDQSQGRTITSFGCRTPSRKPLHGRRLGLSARRSQADLEERHQVRLLRPTRRLDQCQPERPGSFGDHFRPAFGQSRGAFLATQRRSLPGKAFHGRIQPDSG